MAGKSVLIMGLDPTLIDFSAPDFAAFDLTAAKVLAAIKADGEHLRSLGYDVDVCLTDFGETAEAVAREHLRRRPFDCVMIGAGVRSDSQELPVVREAHQRSACQRSASQDVLQHKAQ